ncbi:MAG TPA: zinc-dependent metalloprotease [Acidobacteriaceae bacterium]|nr:zinc-dependent metalloprotease [Acidobacteriaceae bacterium]
MLRTTSLLLAVASLVPLASPTLAQEAAREKSLSARTGAMKHMPGLLPMDWDAKAGKLYLEVPLTADAAHTRSQDLIYFHSTPWSVGSSQLGGYGLDRGQVSEGVIVHFERTGPKVLLVEPNAAFRSSSADPAAQMAVMQSFPVSVLAGFTVDAEDPSGTVLVDATPFFLSDAHHVAEALAEGRQGSYHVDAARSTIVLDDTKAFPKNTVVEAALTFVLGGDGLPTGRVVEEVTPNPRAITIRERQSFVELPPPGYTPRRFSPRAGYIPSSWRDYDVALGEPLNQQFILRHRLIKKDPQCTHACEAVAPIQYYVDRGAPEPIRTALVEGARWWDQAFQAAGWAPGTFRVDLLPEGADPMDVRYNIIQWVHRYTRGWSYGDALADPRTGEIIKGNVTLGSLRGRQDYLIAEALLAPYAKGRPRADEAHDEALQMVLQRIRQLAAHETGHTLGLAHNFAASSFPHPVDETVSVMDYPHPWVTVRDDGVPDLSHAYPAGIGLWDKVAIDYGYREFDRDGKPYEDAAALDKILRESEQRGLVYITDEDARPLGSAHPHAHLWDNGTDPATELDRVLTVRAAAMARFGEDTIREGAPLAQMEDTLAPLYLFHRYQTEAAAKEIGGLDYRYNVRGDGQMLPEIVPAADQRHALASVLKTLSPQMLTLPEPLLKQLPPRPPGLPRTQESFAANTGVAFDPVAAAQSAADLTLALVFNPQRANRLVEYHARDSAEPSLEEVIGATLHATAVPADASGLELVVKRAVDDRIVEALLTLAASPDDAAETRAIVRLELMAMTRTLAPVNGGIEDSAVHMMEMKRITSFLDDPEKFVPAKPVPAPPGMPIGDDEE